MARLVLGSGIAFAAGSYWYVGGFHDPKYRVGELPFDAVRVRYRPHARYFDDVFKHVVSEFDYIREKQPGEDARYVGVFVDDPGPLKAQYGEDAYLRYAIGYVAEEGDDEKGNQLAEDGFREGILRGGKAVMADFPVPTLKPFDLISRYLMSHRVIPRVRNRQRLCGVNAVGGLEYYHEGIVTVALPLDPDLAKEWMLDGVESAKPPPVGTG
mmetsp:Transcript_40030/g.159236  ORF Transcript_40030/g.159236 Transcript_40030/m.159236 type:complete len:212 (-) Transcript_40030:1997-2632(-)